MNYHVESKRVAKRWMFISSFNINFSLTRTKDVSKNVNNYFNKVIRSLSRSKKYIRLQKYSVHSIDVSILKKFS